MLVLGQVTIRRLCYFTLKLDSRSSSVNSYSKLHFNSLRSAFLDGCGCRNNLSSNRRPVWLDVTKRYYHLTYQALKKTISSSSDSFVKISKNPDILVTGVDGQKTLMKKVNAVQIAVDKGLKLVRVAQVTESNPNAEYRLMTGLEYRTQLKQQKDTKQADKSAEVKTVKVGSKIAEHDLGIKLLHVSNWLQAGHRVKVYVIFAQSHLPTGDATVFNRIVSATKETAVVKQVQKTAEQILFFLAPKRPTLSGDVGSDSEASGDERKQKPLKLEDLRKLRNKNDDAQ